MKFANEHLKHGGEFWKSVFWFDETWLEPFAQMDTVFVALQPKQLPQLNAVVGA